MGDPTGSEVEHLAMAEDLGERSFESHRPLIRSRWIGLASADSLDQLSCPDHEEDHADQGQEIGE